MKVGLFIPRDYLTTNVMKLRKIPHPPWIKSLHTWIIINPHLFIFVRIVTRELLLDWSTAFIVTRPFILLRTNTQPPSRWKISLPHRLVWTILVTSG